MPFPVTYPIDRSVFALGLQPTPAQAVAAVLPAVALSHTRTAADPRNDTPNSFGKSPSDRRNAPSRGEFKLAAAASAQQVRVGSAVNRQDTTAFASQTSAGPRSSFTVSVEQIAAAAQARSSPFATTLDQVQDGHIVIFVDGGRFLIPVTGGLSLAEAAAAIRDSQAPVDVDLPFSEEGVSLSITAANSDVSSAATLHVEFQAAGGPGTPLQFHSQEPATDVFAVNQLLQDRMSKAADRASDGSSIATRNARAHKAYAATSQGELAFAKSKPTDGAKDPAPALVNDRLVFKQEAFNGESPAASRPSGPAGLHKAHAAYQQVAQASFS